MAPRVLQALPLVARLRALPLTKTMCKSTSARCEQPDTYSLWAEVCFVLRRRVLGKREENPGTCRHYAYWLHLLQYALQAYFVPRMSVLRWLQLLLVNLSLLLSMHQQLCILICCRL